MRLVRKVALDAFQEIPGNEVMKIQTSVPAFTEPTELVTTAKLKHIRSHTFQCADKLLASAAGITHPTIETPDDPCFSQLMVSHARFVNGQRINSPNTSQGRLGENTPKFCPPNATAHPPSPKVVITKDLETQCYQSFLSKGGNM